MTGAARIHDPLGERMKDYESLYRTILPRRAITTLRFDGRAFHSWTRGLERPYDKRLIEAMAATMLALCEQVPGAFIAYTQSDEISLLLQDFAGERTEPFFGGQVQKIVSVGASLATASFNRAAAERGIEKQPAIFDARAFTLPSRAEAANYLLWRQKDARRNAISMLAEHSFGSKRLRGVPTRERVRLLAENGVDLDSHDERFLAGQVAERTARHERVRYLDKRSGEERLSAPVERSTWQARPAPEFRAEPDSWLWQRIPRPPADET